MKKKAASVLALVLSAVMAASLTGCGSRPKEERKVRVSRNNTYTSTTAYLMQEKGFLEKHVPEGVTVEWSQLSSGVEQRDAIVAEQIDIGAMGLINYISAHENGLPLTLLSYGGSSPAKVYSNDPAITAMDGFTETSKIAIQNKSTFQHMAFLAYCKETLGDAMIYDGLLTAMPAADTIASLQTSRDLNGAVLSYPTLRKAEEIEGVVLLADLTEVIEEYSAGVVFVANSDYHEKNPDIIEAFLAAQEETLQFIQDEPEEAARILSELLGVEADEVQELLRTMPPRKEMAGYDKHAQLMYEAGILTEEPTKFADLPNYEKIPK